MKSLFLALQDQRTHRWSPVARVVKQDDMYKLSYTKGARDLAGFEGFGRMSNLLHEYVSKDLFPLLKNRVLPESRPEYKDYLQWLGLSSTAHDALEELSRSGGVRATDSIELIPCPEPNEKNLYEAYFFVRGIRYFPPEVEAAVDLLNPGDRLFVLKDVQNVHDAAALMLRTGEPISLVGYAPRYYSEDISKVVSTSDVQKVEVVVARVNRTAPLPYRILCKVSAPWPPLFAACSSDKFEIIASEASSA